MQAQTTQGFAPDSTYATYSADERAASDRMEAYFNQQRGTSLALADEACAHPVSGMSDKGLRNLAKHYRRELEDLDDGTLKSTPVRRRLTVVKLRDIEREQEFRAALAESWFADEQGTHSFTSFHARGGLAAVVEHGALRPSYDLAVLLDRTNFMQGLPCIFDWPTA